MKSDKIYSPFLTNDPIPIIKISANGAKESIRAMWFFISFPAKS